MSSDTNTFSDNLVRIGATIPNTGTDSSVVDLQGATLLGIQTPAALTGTSLSFKVGLRSGECLPLYDRNNTLVTITMSASRSYQLDPTLFAGYQFVQLVSGSAEGADRAFVLSARGV